MILKIKKLNDRLQWTINIIDDVFFADSVNEIFERIKFNKYTDVIDGYFWHNMYITNQNLMQKGYTETQIYRERN
jgi:hypothetical protein